MNVVEVNLQSQRFELGGDDAINFLTMDGFEVVVEGTIEFAIERAKAAYLTHRVGDLDDVLKKVILPRARGFSRLEAASTPPPTTSWARPARSSRTSWSRTCAPPASRGGCR